MKKYLVSVQRSKVNEFEVEAESKAAAEDTVRDLLNKTSILNCKVINLVPTEITITSKKMRNEKHLNRVVKYYFQEVKSVSQKKK